jgi:hypothetical protein
MIDAVLLDPADLRWTKTLERYPHDVYQRPEWAVASEVIDGGRAQALVVTSGAYALLIPLIARPLGDGLWDAISPYGYGGVLGDDAFIPTAIGHAEEHLRSLGCVSWFLRLHPILNATWRGGPGDTVAAGRTVSIDLRRSETDHWAETRSGHRSDITRARRAGVTVELDRECKKIDEFADMYSATMRRVAASSYYWFGRNYFRQLCGVLGAQLRLYIALLDGRMIGASMFLVSESSRIVQYHLSASSASFRGLQPSKVILNAARDWGRKHGFGYLHLGGGVGSRDDSLLQFKLGFSRNTHVYKTYRAVVDVAEYSRLTESAFPPDGGDYFPLYRRLPEGDRDREHGGPR